MKDNGFSQFEEKLQQQTERMELLMSNLREREATKHLRETIHSGFAFMQAMIDGFLDTIEAVQEEEGKNRKTAAKGRGKSSAVKIDIDE